MECLLQNHLIYYWERSTVTSDDVGFKWINVFVHCMASFHLMDELIIFQAFRADKNNWVYTFVLLTSIVVLEFFKLSQFVSQVSWLNFDNYF